MSLSRESQINLARHLMSIDALTSDPRIIEQLALVAAELLAVSGFEDNGVAFDLSEYLHEKLERLRQGDRPSDNSWESYAYASLCKQLEAV